MKFTKIGGREISGRFWLIDALISALERKKPVQDADEACRIMFYTIAEDPERNRAICFGVDFTDQIKALLAIPADSKDYNIHLNRYICDVKQVIKTVHKEY